MENLPPPFSKRKILPRSIDQSVLLACNISQIPSVDNISNLVLAIATNMIIMREILANLVNKPNRINTPLKTSRPPTNEPRNSGYGSQTFSNRPAPRTAGNTSFWIPSERNTIPTIKRMIIVLLE